MIKRILQEILRVKTKNENIDRETLEVKRQFRHEILKTHQHATKTKQEASELVKQIENSTAYKIAKASGWKK